MLPPFVEDGVGLEMSSGTVVPAGFWLQAGNIIAAMINTSINNF
jgi:hypothetical protein